MKLKIVTINTLLLLILSSCHDTNAPEEPGYSAEYAERFDAAAQKWERKKVYDSAFFFYNATCKTYLALKDKVSAATALLNMADIQLATGDYQGSDASVVQALSLYNTTTDTVYMYRVYNTLGSIHKNFLNNDKALIYYKKAHSLQKDPVRLLEIESNIARIYINTAQYAKATELLQKSQKSAFINKDLSTKAYITDRAGFAAFKLDSNKGLADMNAALDIRQKINDAEGLALSYLHLAEYYAVLHPETSKICALKAYDAAQRSGNPDRILEALIQLIACSNGNDAKLYSQKYVNLDNETEKKRRLAKERYNTILSNATPKLDIEEHTARLEISKDNNKILALALIASIFSSILLFYQLTQKHKRERLLDAYAAETKMSKKIHDEIANELYTTLHYIENEEVVSGTKKDNLIAQLDNIYMLTRNISRETNDIDTGLRYPVQLKLLLGSYIDTGVNIIVKGISKINWDKIESTKKIATYRSLQELMVNMKKHSQATVVLIDFSIDHKKVKIIYSDNGVGAGHHEEIFKNGLQNVENRMVSIGGSIIFDTKSNKGFHLTLTYPAHILYV